MSNLKLKTSQATYIAEEIRTSGTSSIGERTWVKFMCFCRVLFTFNKYSEFLASLVISIHAAVGQWRMDFERSLW
jgi:hypothetical protein